MRNIRSIRAGRAVLGLFVCSIILAGTGCDKEAEKTPAKGPPDKANPLTDDLAIRVAAADGTTYVFADSGACWVVGDKSVQIDWTDFLDFADRDSAWSDAYGGVYITGKTALWYFRSGAVKKVTPAKQSEIRSEDHRITPKTAAWAASKARAQQDGKSAGIEDAKPGD